MSERQWIAAVAAVEHDAGCGINCMEPWPNPCDCTRETRIGRAVFVALREIRYAAVGEYGIEGALAAALDDFNKAARAGE